MHYINGKFTEGNGDRLSVYDKYTGKLIKELNTADEKDIDNVIQSADEAFNETSSLSSGERQRILHDIADGVEKNAQNLAEIICSEAGKPIDYANTELQRAQQTLHLAAEETIRFGGEKLNLDYGKAEGRTAYTVNMPVGPVLGITPFNFPLNLMMHKVAPAIATGNPIIIKPASSTPVTAIEFSKIIDKVDMPKGMFNLIIASGSKMGNMVESDKIKKITFTGSDKVGWDIKKNCGKKHITLELGGNAPVVIDRDTDLQSVAEQVAYGTLLYAGQICISTQRIIALSDIYDDFKDILISEFEKVSYGNPHEKGTVCGPMISESDVDRVSEWIDEAKQNGAKILYGGKQDKDHNILKPTLIENASEDSKIIRDEIFGPVGVMQKAKDFEDAIRIANDTRFGLQCGIFTNSLSNMKSSQRKLRYGGVIFNSVPGFRMDYMPYGGVGDSGFGREGTKYAMESMVEKKLIVF
jgi:glyceraldehyde-3-phosphate dehydrogenase (NADP+)